ncbi:cyanase [Pseudomonas sp. 22105]|uniref:Cyanate hydratase n=1 Tax=Pseudomonas glycinae TaxID=1785145 RepID=A0ABM5ZGM5_9PSED|nr:cyanase [Pseudomonas glycinae]AMQ82837.1 cyanase [Pseudomonas glycinae]AWA40146.1 cyanase [Pseudomonas fluorescens]NKF29684.1 cyanase [Pseudomonas sp. BG5]
MQSQAYNDSRIALTTRVLDAKAQKNLSWQDLADGTGLSLAYVTAALLGQHPLPKAAAEVVGDKLELSVADVAALQIIPLRGSLDGVPTDPTIYRFHEMIQIYGTTLKALVHEQFGDGIISAINFKLDIKKVEDPEGGSRAVVTLDGKFLPLRPF